MKNKLIATIAVSALAMGVSAAVNADSHPYAGFNTGYFQGNDDLSESYESSPTAGLDVGWHFDKDWSVEASQSEGIATHNHPMIRNYSLTTAYRLWGEETQLLAIGGLQNNNWDKTDVVPVLGLGVSHYFTDNVELRGTVVGAANGAEYAASMLALNYHFGTHAEKDVAESEPEKVAPAVVMTKTLHAHFSTDKSIVRADDKVEIQSVADSMKNNPGSTATIVGHTDSTASDEYNQGLSERRAEAVKAVMVDQGVNPDAIETSGRGESEPVGDNSTAEGRQENRRIEAVVTGLPE